MSKNRFILALIMLSFLFQLTAIKAQDGGTPPGPPVIAELLDPTKSFTLVDQGITVMGTVIFDPTIMKYWKLDIKGNNSAIIGYYPNPRVRGNDWTTIGSTRTDSVIEGPLGFIPAYPELSLGSWQMRIVIVKPDDTFLIAPLTLSFTVKYPDVKKTPVKFDYPSAGTVVTGDPVVRGSIDLDQFTTAYRLELLGGNYTEWTAIDGPYPNDIAHPTHIHGGQIGRLPDINTLLPGQYRLRVIVQRLDSNFMEDPTEVDFSVGDASISNLPLISVTQPQIKDSKLSIDTATPLIGTVQIPQGASFFKVDIKDDLAKDQTPRFTDWTTLGNTQAQSVNGGQLGILPAAPDIAPGNYRVRIVILNPDTSFSGSPYEFQLTIKPAPVGINLDNTSVTQGAGGTADAPAVITQPSLIVDKSGKVSLATIRGSDDHTIRGTVVMPPGAALWKIDVVGGDFKDWTTIDSTHTETIHDGVLGTLPPALFVKAGSYRIRLVIVSPDSSFIGKTFEVPFQTRP